MEYIKQIYRWNSNKILPVNKSTDNPDQQSCFKIINEDCNELENSEDTPVIPDHLLLHNAKTIDHQALQPKIISFFDIVTDCDRFKEERFRKIHIGKFIDSTGFRLTIMAVIFINSIIIGIQTDKYLEQKYGAMFIAIDRVFLTVYILEILVKWYHNFIGFWKVGWNVFDFSIVVASLLGPNLSFLGGGRVLGILRVLRALRILRSISSLKGLQIIVQTVMHSIPDMTNIVALLLICMFIFAVLGVSFFGERCPKYFGSLGSAMFSLFICITQDGWMSIRYDLKACGNDILGGIYLVIFIMIGAFIFANLVVAVVVTNLEWAIAEQKEAEKRENHKCHDDSENTNQVKTIETSSLLNIMANVQRPMEIPVIRPTTEALEKYFLILSAIEDNLAEFKKIKEQLSVIVQEIKALAQLEDGSSVGSHSDIGSIKRIGSSVSRLRRPSLQHPANTNSQRPNLLSGDALSKLISMNRRHTIDSTNVNTLNTLLTQLHSFHHFRKHTSSHTITEKEETS